MEKQIRLFFNGGSESLDIFDFEYNAQRMGSAPTITATINSFRMLDIDTTCWCQFVSNGGVLDDEKFLVRNEPDKTKKSTDARYSYTVVFVSEREILDNVYFIDADYSSVLDNMQVSKGASFQFAGTLSKYVEKLNMSLSLSNLNGYSVVIDEAVSSQDLANVDKFFEISRMSYTSALQEIYNQFEVPYYFIGKEIHVGYFNDNIPTASVKYGSDDALIQVSKTSKNNKIVTRCSGIGSAENLPPYYPNLSQTGEHSIESYSGNITKAKIKSVDYNKMSTITHLSDGAVLTFRAKSSVADNINKTTIEYLDAKDGWTNNQRAVIDGDFGSFSLLLNSDWDDESTVKYQDWDCSVVFTFYAEKDITAYGVIETAFAEYVPVSTATYAQRISEKSVWVTSMQCSGETYDEEDYTFNGSSLTFVPKATGKHTFTVYYKLKLEAPLYEQNSEQTTSHSYSWCNCTASFNYWTSVQMDDYVMVDDSDQTFEYSESGIVFVDNFKPSDKSTITFSETLNWLQPQPNLMPSIYRATAGVERFYNAVSGGYVYPEGASGSDVKYVVNIDGSFENEYNPLRFCEHIEDFDDVRPTIKGSVNPTTRLRMDMFSDFAYDSNDSEEFNEEGELKHKFFYAKLRQLDFNLFEHALEDGEVTFSFTTGDCASCQFVMMVDEETKKNTLQVNSSGNIVFNADGTAKFDKYKPQSTQNDTSKNAVWIALKKDDATFGELRPNKVYKPTPATTTSNNGDTFVITNVRMPNTYILNAEKELEDRIITYMMQNNISGYNFDIKFSRIFLEQNKETFTRLLNESSRLTLEFHGSEYQLYVNSFRYKTTHEAILPEISVTISDTLQLSKGGLSTLVSSVKSDVLAAVNNIDIMPTLARYAIRKDQDDSTPYTISAGNLTVNNTAEIKSSAFIGKNLVVDGASKIGQGLTVGDFSDVMGSISGGMISRDGDASFRSIRANYLEVMKLIYNQIKASSAYTVFDDACTIIDLSLDDDGVYTLTFDDSEFAIKDENGLGIQPFFMYDIVHGSVNKLNNYSYSQMGECWMYIVEIPTADGALKYNQVKARMYENEQVSSGYNIPPTKNMTIAHKGNERDETRQSTFYISSKDGNIIQLLNVSSPKLYTITQDGYHNYGVVLGKLPQDLFDYIQDGFAQLRKQDPVLYAKYAVIQNLIQLDFNGAPIKTENNRGEWSIDIAASDSPYINDVQYYDTVTYQGSLYKCMVSNTTQVPDIGSDWLLLVAKGVSPISYAIRTSVTSIYMRGNWISSRILDISVSANDDNGYQEINDQDKLDKLGLSVWFDIDGDASTMTKLIVGGSQAIEIEQGGSVIVAEDADEDSDDDTIITLESASVDLSTIEDHITIHLIKDADESGNGQVIDNRLIPVTKDGEDGVDRVVANLFDNANFEKTVDDGSKTILDTWGAFVTNSYPVTEKAFEGYNSYRVGESESFILAQEINLGAKEYTISFCLKQGSNKKGWIGVKAESGAISVFEPKNSTSHTLDSTSTALYDKRYIISTERVSNYEYFTFRLVLSKGSSVTILFGGSLSYFVFLCQPQIQEGSKATSFTKSQLELAGPAGEAGPAAYPMGVWNSSTTYKKTYNTVPFVYYSKDQKYYMLNADSAKGSSQSPEYTEYWSVFTQFENLNVNVLMANWAKFGSDKGAVFYDKYLFSQDGIEGLTKTESSFGGYMDKMFENYGTSSNPDYRLNGNFIPNLFIDFLHGALKVTRFSEPYISIKQSSDGKKYYAIDANANHNVKIGANVNASATAFTQFKFKNNLIMLPKFEGWVEDGQHFTILKEFDGEQEGLAAYRDAKYNNYDIICCDESILRASSNLDSPSHDNGNWFIWRGLRTKFVMITSGMMLKLRTQIVGSTCYWYIENSSDYSSIDARFFITSNSYAESGPNSIISQPSDGTYTHITFEKNSENAYVNLVNSADYQPLLLAPYGRFSIVSGTNSRENFDIAISIGNIEVGNVAPIRTMHANDYKW